MILLVLMKLFVFLSLVVLSGWLLLPLLKKRDQYPVFWASLGLGLVACSMFVALGVLLRFSNRSLALLFWGILIAATAYRGWREPGLLRQGPARLFQRRAEWAWPLLLFVAFACFQYAFVATPDPASLSPEYHSMRSQGLTSDCWLPYRFAKIILGRLDPNVVEFAGNWRITDRGPLVALLFAAEGISLGFTGVSYPDFVALGTALNVLLLPAGLFFLKALGFGRRVQVLFVGMLFFNTWISLNSWYTWPSSRHGPAAAVVRSAGLPACIRVERALGRARHARARHCALCAACVGRADAAARLPRANGPRDHHLSLVAVAVLAPWEHYKAHWHVDTNRLMKMHFFDQPEPIRGSLGEVARHYFASRTPRQLLDTRITNLRFPFIVQHFEAAISLLRSGEYDAALDRLWVFLFRQLVGAMNLLMFVAVDCRRRPLAQAPAHEPAQTRRWHGWAGWGSAPSSCPC